MTERTADVAVALDPPIATDKELRQNIVGTAARLEPYCAAASGPGW
ncbi:hypothetical protein [Actinacidiphila sp. bgisy144]